VLKLSRAVFRPVLRTPPVHSAAAVVALAALPLAVTVLRGGHEVGAAVTAAGLIGATAFGLVVDDDAAPLTDAVVAPLWMRRAVRFVLVSTVVAVGWAAVLLTAAAVDPAPVDIGDRALEVLAVSGLSVSFASYLRRTGGPLRSGLPGGMAALLTVLTSSVLAVKYRYLPSVLFAEHHDRWVWIALAAWATAFTLARDPATRRFSTQTVRVENPRGRAY
jgi:hypothetical protein